MMTNPLERATAVLEDPGGLQGLIEATRQIVIHLQDERARVVGAEAALVLFSCDPHRFSRRPCNTCRMISGVLDRPYGCVALGQEES